MNRQCIAQGSWGSLEILEEGDLSDLQEFLEKCSDYYDLMDGMPPGPAEAHTIFIVLPDGHDYSDKILAGIFDTGGKLVGVLDVIRDYPVSGQWWIGLLLVQPDQRRKGIGTAVYEAFEAWATTCGAQAITLGVILRNELAMVFWQRLGFADTGDECRRAVDSHANRFRIYRKRIPS